MIAVEGQTAILGAGSAAQSMRHRLAHLVLRLAMSLALVVAALGGAVLATELRPARTALAVHPRLVPVRPVPLVAPTPAAPSRAIFTADDGQATANGSWIAARSATLDVTLTGTRTGGDVRAEAEVVPVDAAFTGVPNAVSGVVRVGARSQAHTTIVVSGLQDGQRYQWRVRALAVGGKASPWSGGGIFGVSVSRPLPPQLAAANVTLGGWSTVARPLFRWTDAGSVAPIAYYEYALTPAAHGMARALIWRRAHGAVLALPGIQEGPWQLRVRAVDLAGNRSRPAVWSFALILHTPATPRLTALDPPRDAWSSSAAPTARWVEPFATAPIAHYQYALAFGDAAPTSPVWTALNAASLRLPGLADGDWQVRIRAVDAAGQVSPATVWAFHLDRQRPLLLHPALFTTSFTPPVEQLRLRLELTKAATVSYSIFAVGALKPLLTRVLGPRGAGPVSGLVWDGVISPKHVAPSGNYIMQVTVVDREGNRAVIRTVPVSVLGKRILISISKDQLWAYDGNTLLLTSLVTNGGPGTPTLPGIFHVQSKDPNFVFHSPWPKGSPLWYPDSPTNYALLYNADGGYFIHDAPWRYNYGPGSNSVAGTPGGTYTGSHGCTNVPLPAMTTLYNWADIGTLVQIVA